LSPKPLSHHHAHTRRNRGDHGIIAAEQLPVWVDHDWDEDADVDADARAAADVSADARERLKRKAR